MSAREAAAELAAVSDEQLMAAVRAGSAPAFGVLYGRYSERSYRVARAVCRDRDRAEEAVQEAFISIWRTRMSDEMQAGNVAAWLLTVVRYRAIDVARRTGRHLAHRADEDAGHGLRSRRSVDGTNANAPFADPCGAQERLCQPGGRQPPPVTHTVDVRAHQKGVACLKSQTICLTRSTARTRTSPPPRAARSSRRRRPRSARSAC